jgi:primosomal protein N' (replication factor Y)
MIAQVVFDLPLDGPFDYLIPEHLAPQIAVGTRVKVSFSGRTQTGYVIGLLEKSVIAKLKPIDFLGGTSAAFNSLDLTFARDFCAYYGCSLGQGLSAILRNKEGQNPSIYKEHKPQYSLYRCQPGCYEGKIRGIINKYGEHSKGPRFLILVPDVFRAETLSQQFPSLKIGTRSSVFECDGQYDCVIMVDEGDTSYKQEQMPMYDAAQVLLARSKMFGFDVAFVGVSPSVELMALAHEKQIKLIEEPDAGGPSVRLVDLFNYKFIPGMISVPVRDALDAALKAGKKSLLVLNRRGSYRLTRCVDCAEILKCSHCDSSLIYSRSEGKYLCRHCTYTAAGDTVCPKCHKPNWRSVGIGVEQLQTELKKYFPQAKIVAFERGERVIASDRRERSNLLTLGNFDILISTSAVLRFQGKWQVQMAAFIDFDAELNRLDMRSSFNAFSLARHISSMALGPVFIQTRNSDHYVLQSLSSGKVEKFYNEELKLRKELGFSPFKHWVKISWRGKSEKSTHQAAQQAYNELSKSLSKKGCVITPPLADAVIRKRDQFRFNVMVQADEVPQAVAFIRSVLGQIKRHSKVIITMNVDP